MKIQCHINKLPAIRNKVFYAHVGTYVVALYKHIVYCGIMNNPNESCNLEQIDHKNAVYNLYPCITFT